MKIITSAQLSQQEIQDEFYKVISYESLPQIDDLIKKVKNGGDNSLVEISNQFKDGEFSNAADFLVPEAQIEEAYNLVDKDFIQHINVAKKNVEEFAKRQLDSINNLEYETNGSLLGHKIIPLNRILAYVPGGNYPLPSSCIMTAVPAKVAGVKEVFLTSPRIQPATIVTAHIAGADKIYKIGGAQAIAAFAYGTETISPVDKIVGPGNKFVTYAKKQLFGTVDIDFLAGPSEVLIIADNTANPELIAADMLAQCEHDRDARAYLLTNSTELAKKVLINANEFLNSISTKEIARESFSKSFCIVADSISDILEIANKRAPEHLELMVEDDEIYTENLKNYGSLFIGENCAEVFGDYVSGTNHVLPTNSAAKYTGGLSVFNFIKICTYQKINKDYASVLSETASFLAKTEGLSAHKLASDLRR